MLGFVRTKFIGPIYGVPFLMRHVLRCCLWPFAVACGRYGRIFFEDFQLSGNGYG